MDQARQFIRWSMPGAVFVGAAVFITLVRGQLPSREFDPLLVVAVTVAVGFLLYQLYFFLFDGGLPLSTVPADRGAEILKLLPQEPLHRYAEVVCGHLDPLKPGDPLATWMDPPRLQRFSGWLGRRLPNVRRIRLPAPMSHNEYRQRRRRHFNLVASLLDNISLIEKAPCAYRSEYTNHADIAHALGACRVALLAAFLVFGVVIPGWAMASEPTLDVAVGEVGAMILNTPVVLALVWVVSDNRGRTWDKANEELAFGLSWFLQTRESEMTVAADRDLGQVESAL